MSHQISHSLGKIPVAATETFPKAWNYFYQDTDIFEVIKSYNRIQKCDVLSDSDRIFMLCTNSDTLLRSAMPEKVKIHSVQQTRILSKSLKQGWIYGGTFILHLSSAQYSISFKTPLCYLFSHFPVTGNINVQITSYHKHTIPWRSWEPKLLCLSNFASIINQSRQKSNIKPT